MKKIKILLVSAFLMTAIISVAGMSSASANSLFDFTKSEKSLSFYNTHTHERLNVTYWRNGRYDPRALEEINVIMRDHRNGHVHSISKELINYVHDLKVNLQRSHPHKDITFHIISGYRSPQTNAMLRARGGGQASKSRHMFGDAIDIRVPGISSAEIRDVSWCLQRGGVGYYKGSDFVHIDTWKVRHWNWAPNANTCKRGNS